MFEKMLGLPVDSIRLTSGPSRKGSLILFFNNDKRTNDIKEYVNKLREFGLTIDILLENKADIYAYLQQTRAYEINEAISSSKNRRLLQRRSTARLETGTDNLATQTTLTLWRAKPEDEANKPTDDATHLSVKQVI